jgi:hypothetical protein
VDLFEPGSGSQVHDSNGGVLASGLFWTLPVDENALRIARDGRKAILDAKDLQVIDNFQAFGMLGTPATVSVYVEWKATGPPVSRGKGRDVADTDPGAFLGQFRVADSTAKITSTEFGFSSRSDPGVSTARTFAEMGNERNGVFL